MIHFSDKTCFPSGEFFAQSEFYELRHEQSDQRQIFAEGTKSSLACFLSAKNDFERVLLFLYGKIRFMQKIHLMESCLWTN